MPTSPTIKQAKAHKLQGETKFQGLDIAIENRKGSERKWYDEHGKESGSTFMHCDYGYIRLTKGTDGDHVDVYVGPSTDCQKAYLVNQMCKPDFKKFDEQKVMLGFDSAEDAKKAYLRQYNDPRFFGTMKEMSMDDFKTKVLAKENFGKKIACGDMLQYFADHPAKLKEKQERDRKKSASLLHTADGGVFGGAAAESSVGFDPEEKVAVSAGWIREKAVSGLAKRNIPLDRKSQAEIARKAIDYVRSRGAGEGVDAARKGLRGVLDNFKKSVPSNGRRASGNASSGSAWRPQYGAPSAAEQANSAAYDAHRSKQHTQAVFKALAPLMAATGATYLGGAVLGVANNSGREDVGRLSRFSSRAARQDKKGKTVDFDSPNAQAPSGFARGVRSVALPVSGALTGAGSGGILGQTIAGNAGLLGGAVLGGGLGLMGGIGVHKKHEQEIEKHLGRIDGLRNKAAAVPMGLLRHGAVGGALGAAAGGLGGAMHAQDGHRGQGALRGALVGAGLGAAGGAGVHSIKAHGARQLATLRGAAGEAEEFAGMAHRNAQIQGDSAFWAKPSMPGGRAPAPAPAAPRANTNVSTHIQRPQASTGAETIVGKPNANVGPKVQPKSELVDTHARANMTPERYGWKATENRNALGVRDAHGQNFRPMTRDIEVSTDSLHGSMAPAATPAAPPQMGLSRKVPVAEAQAAAAGGRAAALSNAANTLEQQHGVMNQAINRSALVGGAAGTGLMGYMAVPKEYGGVGSNAGAPKTASGGRVEQIADRVDDVGIGILASPYVNDMADSGFKKMMMRGGRTGQVGAWGHAATQGLGHVLHHPVTELTGLALVAPGVAHPIAKGINRMTGGAPAADAAKLAGRLLANEKLGGAARLALGLGAIGAVGAGLYGAKKGIDTAAHMTHPHRAASFPRVVPGMAPPISV